MSGADAERDTLLSRLARFEKQFFPRYEQTYRDLVAEGQRPKTLFIGCSDSRVVPYALMDCGPGELFIARNVGNLIPPWDPGPLGRPRDTDPHRGPARSAEGAPTIAGFHGTAAAIEFAVLQLQVQNIVVCGHSHCGAIRALYEPPPAEATHLNAWLDLARDAVLPVQASPEALRRVEQRSLVIQLERLLTYPMVERQVRAGQLFLHAWYYVIEEGQVLVLDAARGAFVPHAGLGRPVDTAAAPGDVVGSARSDGDPRVNEIDASHWFRMPGPAG
ncbi:MAG: carbonic anhydrase [Burkholderiaceae bacterium]|nr:carbonic anhydrase [Burkholderiaceae bacterium]